MQAGQETHDYENKKGGSGWRGSEKVANQKIKTLATEPFL